MLKAFAIKGVTLLTGLAATRAVPVGWVALAIVATLVATIAFIAWAVLDLRNRFFAPVVNRLATDEQIVALHDGAGFRGGTDRAPTLAALDRLLSGCWTRGLRCVALGDAAAVRG